MTALGFVVIYDERMGMCLLPWVLFSALTFAVGVFVFTRRRARWGSTAEERRAHMSGDDYLAGGPARRVSMTRAITITAPPETVWPWIAQLGRGAGWYSIDWLDNGRIESARHIVSWIPSPALGDAGAIGYLRHVLPESELTWWAPRVQFAGAAARLVFDVRLRSQVSGSRLVVRMSADASGLLARPALWIFQFIDGIMATRALRGIAQRVEEHGARATDPQRPETGARDQFQSYQIIYASGERAGVTEVEQAERYRQAAIDDGLLSVAPGPGRS